MDRTDDRRRTGAARVGGHGGRGCHGDRSRYGEAGGRELDLWLVRIGADIVPVDADQAEEARRAWRRFGKGRHPAGLNYGDCFSYALAKARGAPLLFKGDDFRRTDIVAMDVR